MHGHCILATILVDSGTEFIPELSSTLYRHMLVPRGTVDPSFSHTLLLSVVRPERITIDAVQLVQLIQLIQLVVIINIIQFGI